MSEPSDQLDQFDHPPDPPGPVASPAPASRRDDRFGRLLIPVILSVVLAIAAVALIVIGAGDRARASDARSETKLLLAANARTAAQARREQQLATRVENATAKLVAGLTKATTSHNAHADAQNALAAAADAGIDQINNGDVTGGKNAFRTTVTAAADTSDVALAAARADIDSVAAALAALDQATQAKP